MSQEWAEKELSGIDLGDAQLNRRSVILLDRLADKQTASIPHARKGWAETQAAYRFLAQEDIGWEDILAPHFWLYAAARARPAGSAVHSEYDPSFSDRNRAPHRTYPARCGGRRAASSAQQSGPGKPQ